MHISVCFVSSVFIGKSFQRKVRGVEVMRPKGGGSSRPVEVATLSLTVETRDYIQFRPYCKFFCTAAWGRARGKASVSLRKASVLLREPSFSLREASVSLRKADISLREPSFFLRELSFFLRKAS